jgi:hypothetical protein
MWNYYEAMMEFSEEREALCLTTHSLEQYNWTLKQLVGSHPNLQFFTRMLIGQEVDSRRVLIPSTTVMDTNVN